MNTRPEFGELVRRYRLRKSLTQSELAARSQIAARTVSDLERGERGKRGPVHSSTVRQLAAALELSAAEHEEFVAAGQHAGERTTEPEELADFGAPFNLEALPAPPDFVGRDQERQWLGKRLQLRGAVTVISGIAGIGKTSLAAVCVRQMHAAERFPGGIAVVRCHNLTDAATVLRATLALFDPQLRQPQVTALEALGALAHAVLDGRQALIVLDNVEPGWPIEQVLAPLKETGVTLLLTARQLIAPAALPAEANHMLESLSATEAIELFAYALGRHGDASLTLSEHETAKRIVTTLGHHTLAVWLAGVHARVEARDLGVLAHELEEPLNMLDLPEGEVPHAVANAFARSTAQLPQDTRQLLAALAAFATTDVSRSAVLALGVSLNYAAPKERVSQLCVRALLDAYVLADMPEHSDCERLRLHPLMWAVALSLFRRWSPADMGRAHEAIARYYAEYTHRVSAHALFYDDRNVASAVEWALSSEQPSLFTSLCQSMWPFWRSHSRMAERLRYLPAAFAAAEQLASTEGGPAASSKVAQLTLAYGQLLYDTGDRKAAEGLLQQSLAHAEALNDIRCAGAALSALGEVARAEGRIGDAEQYFARSLGLRRQSQDRQGEAVVLSYLGEIAERKGHMEEAERHFLDALAIRRDVEDHAGVAVELSYLAELAFMRGRLDAAEEYLRQSLPLRRALRDRRGEGVDLGFYGQIAKQRGQLKEADDYFQQCLRIDRELHDRPGEAVDLSYLGQVAEASGNLARADDYFRRCLEICRAVDDRPSEGIGLANLGRIALAVGQLDEATTYFTQSLDIRREVEGRKGEGRVHGFLGRVRYAAGDLPAALAEFAQSLDIAREVEDRRGETGTLYHMGQVQQARGHVDLAEAHFRASLALADEIHSEPEGADSCLALGQLLARQQSNAAEGCRLIRDAIRRYAAIHHPGEQAARQAAQQLGCAPQMGE